MECCEPRSEDDSDAGSLVDFVISDNEDVEEPDFADGPVELLQSAVETRLGRRSTRRRRAPVRYVDDQYVALMTDDVDIEVVLSDSDAPSHTSASQEEDYRTESESESESCSDGESESESESECEVP